MIVKLFCADNCASSVSEITGVSRVTVNKIFKHLRHRILELQTADNYNTFSKYGDKFSGSVELDESYFGPRRVRGKPGREAGGKIVVFGVLKRDGKVYTQIIENASKQQLLPIIKGKILEDATIYTDGWKSYDGLITEGYKHHRIYHSSGEFARGKNHVNGIESFWSYAKRRLAKFNGTKKNFEIHLKETEWRFNNRQNNIYSLLLETLRNQPINFSKVI